MSFDDKIKDFFAVISDEIDKNHAFREKIESILSESHNEPKNKPKPKPAKDKLNQTPIKKKKGRRNLAVIDPIEVCKSGEEKLRQELQNIDIEKLLDIVAQYGMDPGKLVMKWKDRERIIERIIEVSISRATKGDAFRAE